METIEPSPVVSPETGLPETKPKAAHSHVSVHSTPATPAKSRARWLGLVILAALPIALGAGFIPRWRAQKVVAEQTRALAVSTVTVVSPEHHQPALGMPLPAELAAYTEAPIYARASGYLKRWLVDIGDQVEAGQLLAEIETPELDQELARTQAQVAEAQAALDLAKSTATRWEELVKTASVSVQETAEKQADMALKAAALDQARANLRRLEELQRFAKVVAPFKGIITARRTDVGQLITAGGGQELFRLAQTSTLRVFVHVPQELTHALAPGQGAEVTLPDLPGRTFPAKVVRTAGAMEPDSRTLMTELEVANPNGELLAGSYAQVRFNEARAAATLTVPSNALLFRSEGMQVALVGPDDKVQLRNLKLGRDYGQKVEVLEGLSPTDKVILNPADAIVDGMPVHVAPATEHLAAK